MTAYMDHKDLANETIDSARETQIRDGVHRVLDRIATAEERAGRPAGDVTLLAATKTRDVGEIMAAIDAGIRLIGENRPQEVVAKIDGLRYQCRQRGYVIGGHDFDVTVDPDPEYAEPEDMKEAPFIPFHLIGQLQSNKISKILTTVNTIESVDSLDLAQKIAHRCAVRGREIGVFLEVNESGEASKSGCDPEQALELAEQIAQLEGLELQGLMTVGAHVDDEKTIRAGYAHLRSLREQIQQLGLPGTKTCRELSMGMSGDLEYAIAEGATIVRVGTSIFGERDFK